MVKSGAATSLQQRPMTAPSASAADTMSSSAALDKLRGVGTGTAAAMDAKAQMQAYVQSAHVTAGIDNNFANTMTMGASHPRVLGATGTGGGGLGASGMVGAMAGAFSDKTADVGMALGDHTFDSAVEKFRSFAS